MKLSSIWLEFKSQKYIIQELPLNHYKKKIIMRNRNVHTKKYEKSQNSR